ncbi:MAG: UPF0301 protein [Chitinophagales bacterium]|nr:MAG: UPF0301 protein [Chitinophagales bacterium]
MLNLKKLSTVKPSKGVLLLAEPFMADPHFRRTVVVLCENQRSGSIGFILNRPTPLKLPEAIDGILVNFDAPLYYGGPVQTDTLHFVHNVENLDGAIKIIDGLYWGGDFEQLKELINTNAVRPENFRFFVGYSGWDVSQLDNEIAANSWITYPAKAYHVFKSPPETLWKDVLREMGGEFALMVNFPEDPQMN